MEQLEDPVLPATEVVSRCPAKQLMVLYKIPKFEGASEFLQSIASTRGKLKKGGAVDVEVRFVAGGSRTWRLSLEWHWLARAKERWI